MQVGHLSGYSDEYTSISQHKKIVWSTSLCKKRCSVPLDNSCTNDWHDCTILPLPAGHAITCGQDKAGVKSEEFLLVVSWSAKKKTFWILTSWAPMKREPCIRKKRAKGWATPARSKPPEHRIESFSKVIRNRRPFQGNLQKISSISEADKLLPVDIPVLIPTLHLASLLI